jgi:hypothetical protein
MLGRHRSSLSLVKSFVSDVVVIRFCCGENSILEGELGEGRISG